MTICNSSGRNENINRTGESEGKESLRRTRWSWEDIIKVNFKQERYDDEKWIELTQNAVSG